MHLVELDLGRLKLADVMTIIVLRCRTLMSVTKGLLLGAAYMAGFPHNDVTIAGIPPSPANLAHQYTYTSSRGVHPHADP